MNLYEDVLIEILLRLPVKSLLQFRYVCKTWYALIKSSRFTHKHLTYLQSAGGDKRLILKYCKESDSDKKKDVVSLYNDFESLSLSIAPPEIEIPGYSKVHGYHPTVHIVGEANGIFCLSNKHNISLMNPVLREFRLLPVPAFCSGPLYGHNSQLGVGFGFDESTNDYKVLRLDDVEDDKGRQYQVGAIYSLSSNSWKDLGRIRPLDSYHLNSDNCYVFFNGSLHWFALGSWLEDAIFAFNMTTELFQEMQPPEPLLGDYGDTPVFFVLENSFLALFFSYAITSSNRLFTIWVMKEYGVADSWAKEYCILSISSIERPLSFLNKDKLITTCNDGELVCYDLPTGQHHIQQLERYDAYWYSFRLMFFNESLISIS